ncbi:hypothetical protein ElyMa_005666400 [Elysia marginata]|uniref:Uncharacterized protein n=1 Tax=Elysia marginata TaxID=1093978 RepID=A0AAV4FDC9_9GAST|nr:hypothetical protein ElyMa_005666400 [Elysia marginata]
MNDEAWCLDCQLILGTSYKITVKNYYNSQVLRDHHWILTCISLDLWGRRGDLRAEEAVFCRHASLSEADLTSSYIAIPVHSLMLSHQVVLVCACLPLCPGE